jgi:hypothetical protein
VIEKNVERRLEIVLMTELSVDVVVIWLGEDERVAVVQSRKAAVLLRGEALEV